jgi:hypothetical protein
MRTDTLATTSTTRAPAAAPPGDVGRRRRRTAVVAAAWPVMLGLALARIAGVLPTGAFVAVAAVVVGVLVARLRAVRASPPVWALVLVGPGLFALVGLTGPSTAREPGPMLLNAAVVLTAGVVVLSAVVALALRTRDTPGVGAAAQAVVALLVGSAGYLVNMLSRAAVVASGAAGQQAAVEDAAWSASSYLLGLPPAPGPVVVLLVLTDLLQLAHLVLGYLALALLAHGLAAARVVSVRAGRVLGGTGLALGLLVTTCAAVAAVLPPAVGAVAAGMAFGLTIPFMSTLLPHALGSLLAGRA